MRGNVSDTLIFIETGANTTRGASAADGTGYSFTANDLVTISVTGKGQKTYSVSNPSTGALSYSGADAFTWESKSESLTLNAWSKGSSTEQSTDPNGQTFTLTTNQSSNYQELLYSSPIDNYTYGTNGSVALQLYHQLARIVINITHELEGSITISSITIGDGSTATIPTSATFTRPASGQTAGTWSSHGSQKGQITPKTESANSCYSAVVIPATYASGTKFIKITTSDSKVYVYSLGSATTLQAGKQYTLNILVKDGNFHYNPLYFVAQYYLNSSKTFDSSTNNENQGYLWKQTTMMNSKFAASTSSYNGYQLPTGEHNIGGVPYHMPTANEWYSIFPFNSGIISSSISGNTVVTENASTFGSDSNSKTATAYKSYWNTYSGGSGVRYGIRFLGTRYCSVWRYRYQGTEGSNKRMEITSVLIDPIGETETSKLSAKMTQLTNGTFTWPTSDSDATGAYVRNFYITGYINGGEGTSGKTGKGVDGFCHSTTNAPGDATSSTGPRFDTSNSGAMSTALKGNGRPIILFRDK